MKWQRIPVIVKSIISALWAGQSPFGVITAMWPTDEAGKYIIQAEGIRLAFTNHGGALTNLWINDKHGRELDIVLGFDTADEYLQSHRNPYLGGALGRYAGLISNSTFTLDGIQYNTSTNHDIGTVNGGLNGWGRMSFDVAAHTSNSITFVVFDRKRNGFPGVTASSLTHTVTPYEWHIAYGVTPVGCRMPISISNQVFWNLDGLRDDEDLTVADHTLSLPFSGLRIETDRNGVPTGDLKGNKPGSKFDFWSAGGSHGDGSIPTIGDRLGLSQASYNPKRKAMPGYDDTFLITRKQPWNKDQAPAAVLSSKKSGIKLDLFTDQEAMKVLTWNEDDGAIPLKSTQSNLRNKNLADTVPRLGGISLQMQDWTDAVNHPEWQRDEQIFWGTDELYVTYSTYKFTVDRQVNTDDN